MWIRGSGYEDNLCWQQTIHGYRRLVDEAFPKEFGLYELSQFLERYYVSSWKILHLSLIDDYVDVSSESKREDSAMDILIPLLMQSRVPEEQYYSCLSDADLEVYLDA